MPYRPATGILLGVAFVTMTSASAPVIPRQQSDVALQCRAAGPLARVPELAEGSGVAAALRNPGRAWALNDSGDPVLVALDDRGTVRGRVQVTGAAVEDWEAIALGPCPEASCLYIGDIGDNDAQRKHITIYRVPEPHETMTSVPVRNVFHATYPDGPQDAETLLVTPGGEIFIVTKGETRPVRMYRFPRDMQPGSTVALSPVGSPRTDRKSKSSERITDGAVSPNGAWIVLRTTESLLFHATAQLMTGNWGEARRVDLRDLGERRGEGVAFADATTLYVVGEGGGGRQPGTFGRLTCTF